MCNHLHMATNLAIDDELLSEALRLAEAACRLEPKHGYYVNTLGVAQYRAGQYAEALATLTRSEPLNTAAGIPDP